MIQLLFFFFSFLLWNCDGTEIHSTLQEVGGAQQLRLLYFV
jgi:hypothetical protein